MCAEKVIGAEADSNQKETRQKKTDFTGQEDRVEGWGGGGGVQYVFGESGGKERKSR